MKKLLIDRIDRLTESISNLSEGDTPDLVFIEQVPEGFKVTEDYFKRNAKGQVIRGVRRKTYIVDDVSRLKISRTAIFMGEVDI